MAVGFAILAHERLDRVAALVRHLQRGGGAVAVHLDARVPRAEADTFRASVGAGVGVLSTHVAEWGHFGLVEASLSLAAHLLTRHPDLTHVCLLSGACLPLRPLPELVEYLAADLEADYIESVPVDQQGWVQDGLSHERFTLYHPFSHRRQRWLFSRAVDVQRKLRIRRRLPDGLAAHLGMQWWCLSVGTLRALLDHPDLPRWKRFFRLSWIPDEGFFQTVVRKLRPADAPRPPLHLMRFNARGRPTVFHDDHLSVLTGSGQFFARKVDPDADGLYASLLAEATLPQRTETPAETGTGLLENACAASAEEGRGLLGPSRLPKGTTLTRCDTVRPYLVLICPDAARIPSLHPALRTAAPGHVVHGRLFAQGVPSSFACGTEPYRGNLSGKPELRDYRAAQFLQRLVWLDRDRPVAFILGPGDEGEIRYQLVTDANARLLFLAGADVAEQMLTTLGRPFGGRAAAARRPLVRKAWHRALAPTEDISEAIACVAAVIRSDWTAPDGWIVPE